MYTKQEQLKVVNQKKTKKKSKKKLLVQACDQLVREIIELRDSRCCTCKKSRDQVKLDVGHYITRSKHCLRWDLRNCHGQCAGCNLSHEHNSLPYTLFMTGRYGHHILGEFDEIIRSHTRFTLVDLERIKTTLELELENLSGINPSFHDLSVANEGTNFW